MRIWPKTSWAFATRARAMPLRIGAYFCEGGIDSKWPIPAGHSRRPKKAHFEKAATHIQNISAPEVNGSRSNGRAGSHHERYGSRHERYGVGSVAIHHNHPPSTKGCKSGVSRETAPIRRITTAALPRRHRNRLATSNGWTWDVGGCQRHHGWGISSPTMSWGGDHHMPKTQT